MKKYILLLVIMLIVLFAASCEKEVMLGLPGQQGEYLIVEGNITNHATTQAIRLYQSASFYDVEKGPPLSGAKVVVTSKNGKFVFQEGTSEEQKGNYYNFDISNELITGENYQLSVEVDNEHYSAQSLLSPVPVVDSLSVKKNIISGLGIVDGNYYDIYVHFQNLNGLNYYLVNIYVNGNIETYTPPKKTVITDAGLDDYASLYVRVISGADLKSGDTITLQLRSISKGQYDFYSAFLVQTELSGNPFAGAPPANVTTNLSKGALGFFQVSSVSEASRIFTIDKALYRPSKFPINFR